MAEFAIFAHVHVLTPELSISGGSVCGGGVCCSLGGVGEV